MNLLGLSLLVPLSIPSLLSLTHTQPHARGKGVRQRQGERLRNTEIREAGKRAGRESRERDKDCGDNTGRDVGQTLTAHRVRLRQM